MNQHTPAQNELLYNPKNWGFMAFFLSPLLPAVFFYRNSKLLHTANKGRQVLIGTGIYVVCFLILAILFEYYALPILLIEAIIAVIIAKQLAKTQLAAYEEMKKTKGLKGGRNEAPMIGLFLVIWTAIAFVIPTAIEKYAKTNNQLTPSANLNIYAPKNIKEQEVADKIPTAVQEPTQPPQGKKQTITKDRITIQLPAGYTLSENDENPSSKSFRYGIVREDGIFEQASWNLYVIPLEAIQLLDQNCPPGDCMRDQSIYPTEEIYLTDLKDIRADDETAVTVLNGQKYYAITLPTDGDSGYTRHYLTYLNDTRIVIRAWAENKTDALKNDDFLKQVRILNIQ